ncbi:calponin homology domain-containing protein DDB_G0272472-like isoform X1 [Montipora capricornis]|uniref:calponin homology domain-containing protein DDB_G0272472-like isoform X1 n=1 Tax=Montipora capricornis TaxID=246305 RepID=UPI0035F0FD00
MADNSVVEDAPWFSAELKILEAEYEKSKLRVLQDTLLCKRSMIELELLCKDELLQKNTRVNNRLKKQELELQEQVTSLSREIKKTSIQLQSAQNTLQDEKAHHDLEKRKLEENFRVEMEQKTEEHKKRACSKENLLQEKIKNWQEKHLKAFKEAEDLRMELRKKNVAVKTKAIQTQVSVEDASTMAQVESRRVDAGIQVEETSDPDHPANHDECVRNLNEANRKTSVSEKRGGREEEIKGRKTYKTKAKDVIREKRRKNAKNENGEEAEKVEGLDDNDIVGEPKEEHGGSHFSQRGSQQEVIASLSGIMSEKHVKFNDSSNVRLELSSLQTFREEGNTPLLFSKTPRRGKETTRHAEMNCEIDTEKADMNNSPALIAENVTSVKKQEDSIHELGVCVEKPGNEQESNSGDVVRGAESARQDENDEKMEFTESSVSQLEEEQSQALFGDHKIVGVRSKKTLCKELSEESKSAKVKKRKINEKPENIRTKKSKEVAPTVEEMPQDETEVEKSKAEGGRVLRSRGKKQKGLGRDSEDEKSGKKNSKQNPLESDETAATEKSKTDDTDLKGREPVMFLASSPQDHQIADKTVLSSNEIDTHVDNLCLLNEVTSHATQWLPETDADRCKGVRDYSADQESCVALDHNRIRAVEEKLNHECLHSRLDGTKTGNSPGEAESSKWDKPVGRNDLKKEFSPRKYNIRKRKEKGKENDGGVDCGEVVLRGNHKAKSTKENNGAKKQEKLSKEAGKALKGNAESVDGRGKKRKPARSMRKVLAPADQQSRTKETANADRSPILENTKKRKTLFNSRENSIVISCTKDQQTSSFENTKLSKSRNGTGIPPPLSAFLRSFIVPKLKKSL